MYKNVSLYSKAIIFSNILLQIQVQANKVALEVAHLQVFLDHWGNGPCTIAWVPASPTSSCGQSPSQSWQQSGFTHPCSHPPCRHGSNPPWWTHSPPLWVGQGWPSRGTMGSNNGGSGWPSDDTPTTSSSWPYSGKGFPHLALVILPRSEDKDKEKEKDVDDGWSPPPDVTPNPTDVWGKHMDESDLPGSAGTDLAT